MSETIKITELVPADYNPRKIDSKEFLDLKNSISEFGFVDPIIINLKNNHIIGGHQRYDVLLEEHINDEKDVELNIIKLGDIGWVFPNEELEVKSEDHEKALNIALNKIRGEWDEPKLNSVLNDLGRNNFDINLTGFDTEPTEFESDKEFELKNFNKSKNVSFGRLSIMVTQNEYFSLLRVYEEYLEKYGVSDGFMKHLLGLHK